MAISHVTNLNKQKGFSLSEGLFALLLFGSVLLWDFRLTEDINIYKKAKVYSEQTYNYANLFSNYLAINNSTKVDIQSNIYQNVNNYSYYKSQLINIAKANGKKQSMMIIPLNSYDNKSIFHQYPCMLLYYDNSANQNEMMGLIYYAGGYDVKDSDKIVLRALNFNPRFNLGYFTNNSSMYKFTQKTNGGNILDSNGFVPNQSLIDYISKNACKYNNKDYYLSKTSIMFNMQLMTEFNDKLIAVSGIKRTTDQTADMLLNESGLTNKMLLPGHIFNDNTLKSNLELSNQLILKKNSNVENDPQNYAIKLSGTNDAKMLNIGQNSNNDNNTAFITNSIQANNTIRVGSPCEQSEIGKVAVSGRETIRQGAGEYELARNIVTCSKNLTLCPSGYCYLSIKQTKFSFNNPNGLEDSSTGLFRCPSYAPYVASFSTTTSAANVDVFRNLGNGMLNTNSTLKNVKTDNGHAQYPSIDLNPSNSISLSRYYNCSGNCSANGKWSYVQSYDVSEANINHGNRDTLSYANVEKLNGNTTLRVNSLWNNCSNVCPNLNEKYGYNWVDATTIVHVSPDRGDIDGTPIVLGGVSGSRCACAKMGGAGNDYFYGLAIIDNNPVHIQSVTCSNYPNYSL